MIATIPCLTIRQPHLAQILDGSKPYEYRTWETRYRGPIALHAAKNVDRIAMTAQYENAPRSAIVAVADLVSIETHPTEGFAWKLENVRALSEPVPYSGQLGLFAVPLTLIDVTVDHQPELL